MDVLGTLKIQQVDPPVVTGIEGPAPAPAQRESSQPTPRETHPAVEATRGEERDTREKDTEQRVERIVNALKEYVQSARRDLHIKVHKPTGEIMVQVISSSDGKVIREIPSEEVLNLAARIEEMMGVLYDANA
ncbi:MAG: flagellar protein FlaG [Deltaproteobacteria bacterium]|nr:flagellar protein FlaG [Deltaproteobacteria bacterium]